MQVGATSGVIIVPAGPCRPRDDREPPAISPSEHSRHVDGRTRSEPVREQSVMATTNRSRREYTQPLGGTANVGSRGYLAAMARWACANCGCSIQQANRRRRRLGLGRIRVPEATCTATCQREHAAREHAVEDRGRRVQEAAREHAEWVAAIHDELRATGAPEGGAPCPSRT